MLHSLSCSNFYSFADRIGLDFELGKSDPVDNVSAEDDGERVGKVIMISGHNASGSNFS